MQNPIYLYRPGHLGALERRFGAPDTTIVLGEVPVGRNLRQRRGLRVPDLLVAFGVDPNRIIADRGYAIDRWGKPPDFVLEIASETTGQTDITDKRDDYAALGIPEYWRFDPSGGQHCGAPLAGESLVDGAYQPISIVRVDETHLWGRSSVLGLALCWEDAQLRWYDPVGRRYLRTFDEIDEERIIAERQRDAAEERIRELEAELKRLQTP